MSKQINDLNKSLEEQLYLNDKQDKTDSNLKTNDKTIVGAINELFQDVDSGKQLIAGAIGDSSITKDSTFQAMSNAIAGRVKPEGNASANQVLQGCTFMNSSGQLQTGVVPYLRSNIPNVTANCPNHYMTGEIQVGDYSGLGGNCVYFAMPTGVYNTIYWLMSYCPDLKPENIVSGKNILGVIGTATAIKVSAGSRFTFYSNTTRSSYFSNANYSNSTGYRYTLEFDGTYTVTGSMYTSYNSVTLYVKVVLADSSGNTIQEFGENSHKTGSTNGGYVNTGNLTITGKAGQMIMLYGKCHYSKNTSQAGSHNFNGLTVTGNITRA